MALLSVLSDWKSRRLPDGTSNILGNVQGRVVGSLSLLSGGIVSFSLVLS